MHQFGFTRKVTRIGCGAFVINIMSIKNRDLRTGKILPTHGMKGTRFYKILNSMKDRCNCKSHKYYYRYGGRGIKVCKRWNNFENFMEDMYPSYVKHAKKHGEHDTEIDRINNNRGYYKNNCRWSTHKKNCRNTSINRIISHNGRNMTLIEWSEETGIGRATISRRIDKYNWSIKKALETPVLKRKKYD